ncbi:MAG TPA: hypothetical protein VFI31_11720 [Pirellulales bacterium]|nr:hypothetical protein [Pirellulales bacterium]
MRRPQFSLKTLLWLMAVVAAFCTGMIVQRELDRPVPVLLLQDPSQSMALETIELPDGSRWFRPRGGE